MLDLVFVLSWSNKREFQFAIPHGDGLIGLRTVRCFFCGITCLRVKGFGALIVLRIQRFQ